MGKAAIRSVETVIVDLPFRRHQQFARNAAVVQSSVVVRLSTNEGVEGIGESVTPCGPWWSGDSVEAIKSTIDTYLAPLLIGEDPLAIEPVMAKLHKRVNGNAFAKAGLEMALMDCTGKMLGARVCDLLGGEFRGSLPIAWPIASNDFAKDVAEMDAMLAEGRAQAFKVKMGFMPVREDVSRVLKLAEALGARGRLRVDPNEAWDEAAANWALAPLEEAGVEMIEQPVPRWNLDAMARLTQKARSIVMIDEGVSSNNDMIEVVKRAAAGLVSLKLMKTGGLRATKRMADISLSAGIPVYLGTFLETSIGTAANMHLAAAMPDLPLGGECIGPMLLAEDICEVPANYDEFRLHLPTGIGLGVAVDADRLEHFRRDRSKTMHVVRAVS